MMEDREIIMPGSVDTVFADPPYNIGYEYDEYLDNKSDVDYLAWSSAWVTGIGRILKPNGTFWLAMGDRYAAELKIMCQANGFHCRSWVIWYFTFGVNSIKKFTPSHTHLFHFVKNKNDFTFNANSIRVPSARQLVYGDKRAKTGGRLPDDTWILRPQDMPEGFMPYESTWYYPRIAGTFKERSGFHGCQMPEQLLGRIIRVSSNECDLVVDPFAGSASTLIVAKKLGRRYLGFELSENYVTEGRIRLGKAQFRQPLDGAEDPIVSAPKTKKAK